MICIERINSDEVSGPETKSKKWVTLCSAETYKEALEHIVELVNIAEGFSTETDYLRIVEK